MTVPATSPAIAWRWRAFAELTVPELHAALQLRARVFVVEQNCPFLEIDGRDPDAYHLLGYVDAALVGALPVDPGEPPSERAQAMGDRHLAAYARVFAPGVRFEAASIGRVVTHPAARGGGAGLALMREAIAAVEAHWPGAAIHLDAQQYLERFYQSLGFRTVGATYLEDGIPHIPMLRPA